MNVDMGTTWARVQHRPTGERGWLNLQTDEVFTDDMMVSLIRAAERGAVVGDPTSSTEWISAERDPMAVLGVDKR